MTNNSTDTPLTDACPHCGAKQAFDSPWDDIERDWICGSIAGRRDDLCQEREARQKAEAEVERLKKEGELYRAANSDVKRIADERNKAEAEVERMKKALQLCFWATNTYDGNYTRACDNVATIAIEALKTQDK